MLKSRKNKGIFHKALTNFMKLLHASSLQKAVLIILHHNPVYYVAVSRVTTEETVVLALKFHTEVSERKLHLAFSLW